jgi:hypothetical protein
VGSSGTQKQKSARYRPTHHPPQDQARTTTRIFIQGWLELLALIVSNMTQICQLIQCNLSQVPWASSSKSIKLLSAKLHPPRAFRLQTANIQQPQSWVLISLRGPNSSSVMYVHSSLHPEVRFCMQNFENPLKTRYLHITTLFGRYKSETTVFPKRRFLNKKTVIIKTTQKWFHLGSPGTQRA